MIATKRQQKGQSPEYKLRTFLIRNYIVYFNIAIDATRNCKRENMIN